MNGSRRQYASIIGIQGFEVPKWTIAVVTVISTSLGWWWLTRAGKCGCKTKPC
jgi:ABC-type antimicrobial peptide transport system permease subunit